MKETDIEGRLTRVLTASLSTYTLNAPVIIKHADKFTSGVPDRTVSWNGSTTWLELKRLLRPNEEIKFRPRQLDTLCDLEVQTGGRSWLVVYVVAKLGRHNGETIIYRPTVYRQWAKADLTRVKLGSIYETMDGRAAAVLWSVGAIRFTGHAHVEVANLIRWTHTT